ncbi:phosphodiester glycosidase family protein [bacterium]|nr:phosphodiester glycosidase family protein [bacterium]
MNKHLRSILILLACLIICRAGYAWTTIGDGIEYQEYKLPDPNNLFVTRMLRSNTNAIIDCIFAKGLLASNQSIPDQYKDYNGALFFDGKDWGPRYEIVAAINGDFYLPGGVSRGIRINNGWYSSQVNTDKNIFAAFGWTADRQTILSGSPNATQTMNVKFMDTTASMTVNGINRAPADNELCIINPYMGLTTGTDNTVTEALVQLTTPNMISPPPNGIIGFVKDIRTNQGTMIIPFDCIVLCAKGSAADDLIKNASDGEQISITTKIDSYETDGTTSIGHTWQNTLAGISGSQVILEKGNIKTYPKVPIMVKNDPRTAVAFNDTYVFFVVCDGRAPGISKGMTGVELATFCKDTLGAENAINLDGGGSATMLVNGVVKNRPSDGSPRAVANGLIMANVMPKRMSYRFHAGQFVSVTDSTDVRRGPGQINPVFSTVPVGSVGIIADHRLGGIMTKGDYWWDVRFDETEGWICESDLTIPHD